MATLVEEMRPVILPVATHNKAYRIHMQKSIMYARRNILARLASSHRT